MWPIKLDCHLLGIIHLVLGPSISKGLTKEDGLAGDTSAGALPISASPSAKIIDVHLDTKMFYMGSGNQTWFLVPTWQSLYQLSHISSSERHILMFLKS